MVTPDDAHDITQHNKATGSSARCGTTSHSIGPPSTGAKASHSESPDNQLHRADSLACSNTGFLRASPDNRLPKRTHSSTASPDHHASPDNRLHRTDSLACSLAGPLRNSGQPAALDGLTRRQFHRINLRIFTDRLPRHPNSNSRLPTTHRS